MHYNKGHFLTIKGSIHLEDNINPNLRENLKSTILASLSSRQKTLDTTD